MWSVHNILKNRQQKHTQQRQKTTKQPFQFGANQLQNKQKKQAYETGKKEEKKVVTPQNKLSCPKK